MNRRTLLGTCALGGIVPSAGCVSQRLGAVLDGPATTVSEAERAGNLTGYDELDCEISQEDAVATPASAMTFGDGRGEHWVYLLADTSEPTAVTVAVSVDSETIYEEVAKLGGERYTSYEFTSQASYSLSVGIGDEETELTVREEPIGVPPGEDKRVSGQTFCLTTGGEAEEQFWY